jgi:hypothetical protein
MTACGNESGDGKASATDTSATRPVAATECYLYITDKDTISLQITINGQSVTGALNYTLHEKDKSQGVIQGEVRGDTLLADYEFKSEGIVSLREVAFLKKGNGYAEGYGEAEEKDGKMMFKNVAELNYSNTVILKKVQCGK